MSRRKGENALDPQETLRPKFYAAQSIARSSGDHAYAIGFYAGQMEKVLAGACQYCMFRPNSQDIAQLEPLIRRLAEEYGLVAELYDGEFWISRRTPLDRLKLLRKHSPEYHALRAKMCGIPVEEIDPEYHLRSGHAGD